jgi:uncharacterized membrane protein YkvA (DUF1232 family)
MATRQEVEKLVDSMAAEEPAAADKTARKIDAQFASKLEQLEADGTVPREMIERLKVLWKMFHAEAEMPWKTRALVMTALGYFVAPFDLIPDLAGKPGYFDDKMVVNVVWTRLGDAVEPFGGTPS